MNANRWYIVILNHYRKDLDSCDKWCLHHKIRRLRPQISPSKLQYLPNRPNCNFRWHMNYNLSKDMKFELEVDICCFGCYWMWLRWNGHYFRCKRLKHCKYSQVHSNPKIDLHNSRVLKQIVDFSDFERNWNDLLNFNHSKLTTTPSTIWMLKTFCTIVDQKTLTKTEIEKTKTQQSNQNYSHFQVIHNYNLVLMYRFESIFPSKQKTVPWSYNLEKRFCSILRTRPKGRFEEHQKLLWQPNLIQPVGKVSLFPNNSKCPKTWLQRANQNFGPKGIKS